MKRDEKNRIIGCGYCAFEKTCVKRDKSINKAELDCKDYEHYKDINNKNN